MATPTDTSILQLNAPTHFPIKLTTSNFLVWRRQVESTLIGLDLAKYVDGTGTVPAKFSDEARTVINPIYTVWFRQDQIIISALLGSCSETLQPLISSAATAREAWTRLTTSCAASSRGRIVSLKAKLAKNPKGSRSIAEYMRVMRSISDDLALAQSPISEDDLVVNIITQLGEEYNPIIAAIRVRENPISFGELSDVLTDYERILKENDQLQQTTMATANVTQKRSPANVSSSGHFNRNQGGFSNNRRGRGCYNGSNFRSNNGPTLNNSGSMRYCKFCDYPGHDTRFCRKLAKFLKENNISVTNFPPLSQTPAVNTTMASTMTQSPWVMDTGASHHTVSTPSSLQSFEDYSGPDEIMLGDGNTLNISHTGNTFLSTPSCKLSLANVLCVPSLQKNLVSVSKLCKSNRVSVEFFDSYFVVKDLFTGAHLMRGETVHDVYCFPLSCQPQVNVTNMVSVSDWHHKLGHPSNKILISILRSNKLPFDPNSAYNHYCTSCNVNKSHKLPFSFNSMVSSKPLELLYTDVWGTTHVSIDGYSYYLLFVDHFTKYIWLYPLKRKSEVYSVFPQFKRLVENFLGQNIISIFSDNGGEYKKLIPMLNTYGISHFTTPPHTPEHNGSAERRHRHIVETGMSLLHFASLPVSYWVHAFQAAVYLINRLPTHVLNNLSPYQKLFQRYPNYTKLQPFGCLCFPWLRPYMRTKLDPKSIACVFLGYSLSQSAYKCLDPVTGRIYVSRHVRFVSHAFPFSTLSTNGRTHTKSSTDTSTPPIIFNAAPLRVPIPPVPPHSLDNIVSASSQASPIRQSSSSSSTSPTLPATSPTLPVVPMTAPHVPPSSLPSPPSQTSSDEQPVLRPQRERRPNPRYYNDKFINVTTTHPLPLSIEPTTISQALQDVRWKQAMCDEYDALLRNETWELVPRADHTSVGCKWVFRVKRKSDGTVDRFKARLVAKGFLQEPGRDYFETFSPVVKPITIRIILTLALSQGWSMRQLDINNAFLNGTLHENVYMDQPPGFVDKALPGHICRLKKAIYGLKQAPRAWYLELSQYLLTLGFCRSVADHSLFIFRSGKTVIYFLVYVDDIVITGNEPSILDSFVRKLATRFSLKDLGVLHHFLGVEVISTSGGLFLSQSQYVADVLAQFQMTGAKEVATPLCSSSVLKLDDGPPVDANLYRRAIGRLQYLGITRPDVSYAVNRLSQFMHAPTETHWQAVKRVLRYLKGTLHFGLFLRRGTPLTLSVFSDSDWGGLHDSGRSTTAYVVYFGSNVVSWKSARQRSVSRSSTEAEYRALANATAEVIWIQNLLKELGVQLQCSPRLFTDNLSATYVCKNPVFHSRMKHLALDYFFVRELVANGSLRVQHVRSSEQVADLLTKPLGRSLFIRFRPKIGVSDGSSILRGRVEGVS